MHHIVFFALHLSAHVHYIWQINYHACIMRMRFGCSYFLLIITWSARLQNDLIGHILSRDWQSNAVMSGNHGKIIQCNPFSDICKQHKKHCMCWSPNGTNRQSIHHMFVILSLSQCTGKWHKALMSIREHARTKCMTICPVLTSPTRVTSIY